LLAVGGLADDLEPLPLEQDPEPLPDDQVVIGQEDARHASPLRCCPRRRRRATPREPFKREFSAPLHPAGVATSAAGRSAAAPPGAGLGPHLDEVRLAGADRIGRRELRPREVHVVRADIDGAPDEEALVGQPCANRAWGGAAGIGTGLDHLPGSFRLQIRRETIG